MRALLSFIAGCTLLALTGCDGGGSKSTGAALGEPCADGADCDSRFCFIETEGTDGECTAIPSTCSEMLSCSDPCFDDIKQSCTGSGSSCIRIIANITVSCIPSSK